MSTVFDRPEVLLGLALGVLAGAALSWIYFLIWRGRYLKRIRLEAVRQSQSVISGKVHEQLLPYFPAFPFSPKDVRFLGSPVDLVVFDGLDAGALERVLFVEVKTGQAGLTTRERQLRDVVRAGRVEWMEMRREPGQS
jgi:predicted Holliday junction resolvase-like endonuclease